MENSTMNNLDDEYALFKLLCSTNCVQRNHQNDSLLRNIEKKGLKIIQLGDMCSLDENIIPLSETDIRRGLKTKVNEAINVFDILYQTSSTNKTIQVINECDKFSLLITESQTSGQGRRAKQWLSPLADNIYMSICFHLKTRANIHLIPLITALSICKSLNQIGVTGCQIKWPNDIYLDGKKLAGILVESRYMPDNGSVFIVGIGLNVNMKMNNKIDQLWTSLCNSQNRLFNRNFIVSALLSETLESYNKISKINLPQFMHEWHSLDYLFGSEIDVIEENNRYSAFAHGISDDGALLIKPHGSDLLKKVYSADVSIKLNENG